MSFVTADNVKILQARIRREHADLTGAVAMCQVKMPSVLTAADAQAWATLSSEVVAFLQTDPGTLNAAALMDQGQSIELELFPWYDKLSAAGCPGVPAKPAVTPEAPKDPLAGTTDLVKWVVLGFLAVEIVPELKRAFRR
jgi:hypothetical protein